MNEIHAEFWKCACKLESGAGGIWAMISKLSPEAHEWQELFPSQENPRAKAVRGQIVGSVDNETEECSKDEASHTGREVKTRGLVFLAKPSTLVPLTKYW